MALALTARRRALAAATTALAAAALATAVLGRSCAVSPPGPDASVRALVQAARAGDRRAIWDLLSPATQARLVAGAQRATDLVGSSMRYQPLDLISIGSSEDVPPPVEIRTAWRDGDRAIVEVVGAGDPAQIPLVRVRKRWKIDLPIDSTP
ncbi:MAG TPA: hypothetical protein VHE35_16410 [Kofleriaceae bacterium]|nr:hypothetical protein [Kofleriaceae bacterium]